MYQLIEKFTNKRISRHHTLGAAYWAAKQHEKRFWRENPGESSPVYVLRHADDSPLTDEEYDKWLSHSVYV